MTPSGLSLQHTHRVRGAVLVYARELQHEAASAAENGTGVWQEQAQLLVGGGAGHEHGRAVLQRAGQAEPAAADHLLGPVATELDGQGQGADAENDDRLRTIRPSVLGRSRIFADMPGVTGSGLIAYGIVTVTCPR